MTKCAGCPRVYHDRVKCVDCGKGKKQCICIPDGPSRRSHGPKKVRKDCELQCDTKARIRQLKVHSKYTIANAPEACGVTVFDPFLLVEKCWKQPCFQQVGICGEDCNVIESCVSSSSSSSSSSSEPCCVSVIIDSYPICCKKKKCSSSSSSSSSSCTTASSRSSSCGCK